MTLCNLIVDLDPVAAVATAATPNLAQLLGVQIGSPAPPDGRTLAWIDETFGGWWSAEAAAGLNVVARRDGAPIGFATLDARGLKFRWLDSLASHRDVGIFGPFGVAPAARKTGLGAALLRLALRALRERGYARALIPAVGDDALVRYYVQTVGARVAERFDRPALLAPAPRTLVMASGDGSNFQAVLDAARDGTLPIEIVALVGNSACAYALERARNAGVGAVHLVEWKRSEETRARYDERLLERVRSERPDLVLLLGWMHLLRDSFVRAFPEMLNLHPAFLPLDPNADDVEMPDGTRIPAFRGPRAVGDALAAGSRWAGATVHRVTSATDRGPVLARMPLRVEPGEAQAALMARVHEVEHRLVRVAVTRWLYERPLYAVPEEVH